MSQARGLLEQIKAKRLERRFRSPAMFADPTTFSRPQSPSEAWLRLEINSQFFFLNYAALALFILALAILTQPSFLVLVVVLATMWAYALTREAIIIPGFPAPIMGRTKTGLLSVSSGLLLFLFAGTIIMAVVGVCSVVVVSHAVLKNPPTQDELEADAAINEPLSLV